jgi:uncharacterized membrane protein YvlD (DUF360 family)
VQTSHTLNPRRVPLKHFLAGFLVSAFSFALAAWLLPGISIRDIGSAFIAAAIVSVLNALLWPIIARFFSRLILWTAGLLGLVANGIILILVADIYDGLHIDNIWAAMLASLFMTATSIFIGTVLALDDDAVWHRQTMRRMVNRLEPPEPTGVPGILFLQIDGLAEPVLRQAISDGHVPTFARWIQDGTHQIRQWECDLSSQTGASQAGILHGNNTNMPAFRWYDKETGKVLTSNRPRDAAEIEQRQSDGHGLLSQGGVSRSNVFSGDSTDAVLTFSTVTDRSRTSKHTANYFLSDPYAVSRVISLSFADIVREIVDARRTKHRKVEPRLKRGGIYPFLRAATTTILRDLTLYTLMSDIYRGVPVAYADFVGYDEVAHHSGISASTALDTLKRLDQQIARLERAIGEAPRPYHVVILSDHGQTQGATFLQRYDITLQELVTSLIDSSQKIEVPELASEGWGNLNGALTEAIRDEDSRFSAMLRVVVRKRTVDGNVVLGPAYAEEAQQSATDQKATTTESDHGDVIVLASGNLGLVSFPNIEGRATLETLAAMYPELVTELAQHPGIGFLLVNSEIYGPIAMGAHGIRYLADDRVEGEDPLQSFGPNTADHLRRTSSFDNAPDILLNSFYDPEADEGAAFEELIGFHGGLGGAQAEPFLLYPSTFSLPEEPIVGAAAVHYIFKGWLADAAADGAPKPWTAPATPQTTTSPPESPR